MIFIVANLFNDSSERVNIVCSKLRFVDYWMFFLHILKAISARLRCKLLRSKHSWPKHSLLLAFYKSNN